MNNLQISLSQPTLDKFIKIVLAQFRQESPLTKELVNSNGVKVIGNVQVKSITIESLTLKEPNIVDLNKIQIAFELLNIIVEVDVKRAHDEIKILDLPGKKYDIAISWDFFKDEPDIRLTFGIEDFFRPSFTASLIWLINGRDIAGGLNDFDVNDFNLADGLGSQIEDRVISAMKDIIKKKIDNKYLNKVLDYIGDLLKLLPVDNIGNWIIKQITDNQALKQLVEQAVKENFKPQTLYTAPGQFEFGADLNKVSISLADSNPIVIAVKDEHLTAWVSFNEL